jgi:flagellar basal-body rod modification protein FlgD
MAVDSIGATSLAASTSSSSNTVVNQDEFLKILLTQLRFQDPLKPIDNEAFMAQLAQFSSLEFTRQQTEKLDALLTIQSSTQSLALMNRAVEVATNGGNQVGTVTAIRFQNGEPLLTVKTSGGQFLVDLKLSQVTVVNNS